MQALKDGSSQQDISCEVLVAGGGVSGVAAAIASSRKGSRTLLIEKGRFLGGVGERALLGAICGLYSNGDTYPLETLNKGIAGEIAAGLNKMSPLAKIKKIGRVYVLPFSRHHLRQILESLCEGEPNLEVMLGTNAGSVTSRDGKIEEVSVDVSGQTVKIRPKTVVDCTGNCNIVSMAGAAFNLSRDSQRQLAAYSVRLNGLKDQSELLAVKVPYYLAKAAENKLLPFSFRFTHYRPGESEEEGYCKFGIDGMESKERDVKARDDVAKAIKYLSEKIPSFGGCEIVETSDGVIEREGRRVVGEYTLTEDDVLCARKFGDGIVKNSWPIEIWERGKGPKYKYVKAGDYYEIPAGCLKAKGMRNLLCAGRNISVSREAYGSTRVMGTCLALGEQAGRMAADIEKFSDGNQRHVILDK